MACLRRNSVRTRSFHLRRSHIYREGASPILYIYIYRNLLLSPVGNCESDITVQAIPFTTLVANIRGRTCINGERLAASLSYVRVFLPQTCFHLRWYHYATPSSLLDTRTNCFPRYIHVAACARSVFEASYIVRPFQTLEVLKRRLTPSVMDAHNSRI